MPVKLQEYFFKMENVKKSIERLLKKHGLEDFEIYIRAANEEEEKECEEDEGTIITYFDREKGYLEIAIIDDGDIRVDNSNQYADLHIIDTLYQYLDDEEEEDYIIKGAIPAPFPKKGEQHGH